MPKLEPKLQCICCTDPGTITCTGCGDAKYCSRECQETDYQFHKHLCKSFARFQPEHRPSPEMRRVVHFPDWGDKPEFMWLPVKPVEDIELVDLSTLSHGNPRPFHRWESTMKNSLNGAALGGVVSVSYDDNWTQAYTQNVPIMTATNELAARYPWGGPMVCIYGDKYRLYTGEDDDDLTDDEDDDYPDIGRVKDMDMRAYSFIISHIIGLDNRTKQHSRRCGGKVKAVKLLSNGQRSPGAPSAQVVELPRIYKLFEAPYIPALTKAIGFPLVAMECEGKSSGPKARRNDEAAALHVNIDPYSRDFAQPPSAMVANGPGDVYVARANLKPLSPDSISALVGFYRDYVKPSMDRAVNPTDDEECEDTPQEKRQKALEQITPEKWSAFLAGWKSSKKSGAVRDQLSARGGGEDNGDGVPSEAVVEESKVFTPFLGFRGFRPH